MSETPNCNCVASNSVDCWRARHPETPFEGEDGWMVNDGACGCSCHPWPAAPAPDSRTAPAGLTDDEKAMVKRVANKWGFFEPAPSSETGTGPTLDRTPTPDLLTGQQIERAISAARAIRSTGMHRVVTREYITGLYVEDIIIGLGAALSTSRSRIAELEAENAKLRETLLEFS